LITYFTLAAGVLVVWYSCGLAGRLAGLTATALWSAGTAYFFMPPIYSFYVSDSRDVAALALYGTVGLVLARTRPLARRSWRNGREISEVRPLPATVVDLQKVLADLTFSSELGERLKQEQIEVETSHLHRFRCSYADGVRVLSHVLAVVVIEPQLRRVSFHVARRPGVELLFIHAQRIWPPPLQRTMTISKCPEDCSRADFPAWPSYLTATWFDNGYGRTYQIAFDVSKGSEVEWWARENSNL
jgi:hypothetical protein